MQRPSGVKLWQQPAATVLPSAPADALLSEPDEVQAARNPILRWQA